MSIARTPTCFWVEDGAFYGFEGCNGASTATLGPGRGELPAQLHPRLELRDGAGPALSRLWSGRCATSSGTIQQHPTGYLPHRVLLPTYLPRPWDRHDRRSAQTQRWTVCSAPFSKTYREYLATGDTAWLATRWPAMKLAMDHIWTVHDPERAGVIEGEQPNTYDISIYGRQHLHRHPLPGGPPR